MTAAASGPPSAPCLGTQCGWGAQRGSRVSGAAGLDAMDGEERSAGLQERCRRAATGWAGQEAAQPPPTSPRANAELLAPAPAPASHPPPAGTFWPYRSRAHTTCSPSAAQTQASSPGTLCSERLLAAGRGREGRWRSPCLCWSRSWLWRWCWPITPFCLLPPRSLACHPTHATVLQAPASLRWSGRSLTPSTLAWRVRHTQLVFSS